MNLCSKCGKVTPKMYPNNMCQGCYLYFLKGGTENMPPKIGETALDKRGFVICHICGRAYKRLGSHVRESHNMTISEYKEQFDLCNSARTTENSYSQHMRELAYRYNMPEQLRETGQKTRVKKGEKKLRYGKKARLQECLDRSKRYSKEKSDD